MEKDLNNSAVHNSYLKESDSEKSFVGKVKSIISNTPLSKWFRKQEDNRPVIRRRDEVFEDEDISEIQPPSKRVKLPLADEGNKYNNVLFKESHVPVTNSVSNNIFNKIPEPVAGPSGLKAHKLLSSASTITATGVRSTFSSNELLNGHSDSEESTSGYSSVARIGSKEQVCLSQESSKQTSPAQTSPSNSRSLFHKSNVRSNRSLFAESSLSPNMNTSLSSRRPNFNASTFGSPNFVDKTISTKRITNSPFYNGKTIYGGASAYGRSLGRTSQDLKTSLRNSVQIKPVNKAENGNLTLGKTARRILDTIEQYSSPINDAKKIPIVSRKSRQDGLLTRYTGANPYIVRDTKGPSNKELQVPTVPELLRMKTRLQESTESVRQLAVSSKSDLNTEYYKISTKEDQKEKHTGKIKTKVTSVRPKHPANEAVNEINLTPVSLPITVLPKFDFVVPPAHPVKTTPTAPRVIKQTASKSPPTRPPPKITQTESHVQIDKRITTNTTVVEYKFSDPVVVAENMKSIVAINNFKFSEPPTCTKNKSDVPKTVLNFKMPENVLPNLILKKKNCETAVKTAKTLKSGSVMDVLGKKSPAKDSLLEKFKPEQGTWECPVCMIRNQPDKVRCAACETPKAGPVKPVENKSGFGSQFKLSSDKWECGACMVYNTNADTKCVSCTTPRPNVAEKAQNKPVTVTNTNTLPGFGDKFKPAGDTWECGSCMIRNKSELTKCAACETPNPKAPSAGTQLPKLGTSNGITTQQVGFGNAYKAKTDEWECGTCMVRNKESNTKCQCCETPNPKSTSSSSSIVLDVSKDKKPISSFNFGIDKAAATSFSFGIPPSAAPLPKTDTQASSIFGSGSKPALTTPVSFSFGVPASTGDKPKTAEAPSSKLPAETPKAATPAPVLPTIIIPDDKPAKVESRPTQTEFKFGVNAPSPALNNKETTVKPDTAKKEMDKLENNKPTFNLKPTTTTNGEIKSNLFGKKPETAVTAVPAPAVTTFAFGSKPAAVTAPLPSQPSQPEPTKPVFKFGSALENPSLTSTTLNNGFGTTTPSFGTSSTPGFAKPPTNSTEIKPFTFASAATTAKDAAEPASKAPMFSFGQSASITAAPNPPPAKSSGFSFGSTSTPSFNFTAGKTEVPAFNAAPSTNMFGGSTNAGTQNGTFNFGNIASSNNSQKAGFSFGAAANSSVGSAPQSGFNFGASAAAGPSTLGGFNFSGATPNFNAAAKPAFNFSDGSVATFSAQPPADAAGVAAPRKIKRAVRRTQR